MTTTVDLEIIDCEAYKDLCDYIYDPPAHTEVPPTGVVHVPTDQVEKFFELIDNNGHTYVVVSSRSDYGVAYQKEHPLWKDMRKWALMQIGPQIEYQGLRMPPRGELDSCNPNHTYSIKCHSWTRATFDKIPDNIQTWFMTNSMIDDDHRVRSIPFGIAPGKSQIIAEAAVDVDENERKNWLYISWTDYTYERYEIRQRFIDSVEASSLDGVTIFYPDYPEDYYHYLLSLARHRYVLSPPGNGEDCYRNLEALYMGAIPIVYPSISLKGSGIPAIFNKDMTPRSLHHLMCGNAYYAIRQNILGPEQMKTTRLTYWKEQIKQERDKLFQS